MVVHFHKRAQIAVDDLWVAAAAGIAAAAASADVPV